MLTEMLILCLIYALILVYFTLILIHFTLILIQLTLIFDQMYLIFDPFYPDSDPFYPDFDSFYLDFRPILTLVWSILHCFWFILPWFSKYFNDHAKTLWFWPKNNFSAELRFLFDDTSVFLCATLCDRKIGAICAEKSSYTRVDGNQQGKKKFKKKNSFCLDTKRKKADWAEAGVQRWLETCQNFSPIFASILFLALLRTRNKVSLLSHDSPT